MDSWRFNPNWTWSTHPDPVSVPWTLRHSALIGCTCLLSLVITWRVHRERLQGSKKHPPPPRFCCRKPFKIIPFWQQDCVCFGTARFAHHQPCVACPLRMGHWVTGSRHQCIQRQKKNDPSKKRKADKLLLKGSFGKHGEQCAESRRFLGGR